MIDIGVVGGTGYTGVELLRLLAQHPKTRLKAITSRAEAGKQVAEVFPNLRGYVDVVFAAPELDRLSDCDLVYFATPNGTAMTMALPLLEAGVKIVDLSADFRLKDAAVWERWYGMSHASPELLADAVYGLPELNREVIKTASLIANPGCYPTAIVLGFLPLLAQQCVDSGRLIADAKSGVSGAGRTASQGSLFAECADSFKAYGASGHRHHPEITQTLAQISQVPPDLVFVPHLIPMIRGIHATLYAELTQKDRELQGLYEEHYRLEPFVDVLPVGGHPDTRSVRGSNMCRIAVHRPEGGERVIVLSVIDNLVKGAAGQAVQNMNIVFGWDESLGLEQIALLP